MSERSKALRLTNTLTRSKEDFVPIDPQNVRMYVCGPTVYDFAHIGNARPVIVFDVLFRLLRHLYGEDHVTYVRNITNVDDKINARALRDFGGEIASGTLSLNEAIRRVTEKTANQFHKDVAALGCLPPTVEPRATEFVQPRADGKTDMISLIERLLASDPPHAYVAEGEVLFDTASMADYGQLSKRPLDEQQAGARIAVDAHKKNPQDFVLWKLSSPEEPGWDSPWGRGRPGWHIECSAMSAAYLGEVFDIHGGGLDLIFPHHENEIAQSRCAHGTPTMANVWMHNGFLQVEGQKMSKSLGNFVTIHDLLETEKFGGRKWPGEVLRLAMLMTHYREPIDFSVRRLEEAEKELITLASWIRKSREFIPDVYERANSNEPSNELIFGLTDDLNSGKSIAALRERLAKVKSGAFEMATQLLSDCLFLGILRVNKIGTYASEILGGNAGWELMFKHFDRLKEMRVVLANGDMDKFAELKNIVESDGPTVIVDEFGYLSLKTNSDQEELKVKNLISDRGAFIAQKNWTEADRIRDELLAQGIQLKDGKDPVTGERVTTWEVKR